ncbi:hypothetical protein OG413_43930 [Streptomyces sp. NBC_01433]|uniref:hypothetical protein n=1 Tax=Streptomyces sp. NBC_01433 TaxID=2903864 RepID=UPI00225871BB|nr:hypothetical protein [Streptomyces sp. NBC_01433]MCX4682135.1 hypothetical protein [Streptomyces sp. NBC_01433]
MTGRIDRPRFDGGAGCEARHGSYDERQQPRSRWSGTLEQFAIQRERRRTGRAIRRDMGLSGVRDIDGLVKVVSERRQKPITVSCRPLPAQISAACGSSRDFDFIVVDAQSSKLTQLHATMHELGHLLWDDPDRRLQGPGEAHRRMPEELVRELFPGLKPEAVTAFFMRSHYADQQERRVEIFATVMLESHLSLRGSTGDFLRSTFAHRRAGV